MASTSTPVRMPDSLSCSIRASRLLRSSSTELDLTHSDRYSSSLA